MTSTLIEGTVVTLAEPERADWILVEDGTVAAVGERADCPRADRRIDLRGATLVPAFCDAHVHLPATGLYARGLDLRGETSAGAILAALRERADGDGPLFAGNFEDPLDEPLDAAALDRAVGDRPALVARADMHSCVVSSALLERLDLGVLDGVDRDAQGRPTGYLRERAAGEAWNWFERSLPAATQRDAIRAAARLAYAKGVAAVHEMYVVDWRGWSGVESARVVLGELALDVELYVACDDIERVAELGLGRIGGDYFLDGSFGSHTAWMSAPYASPPPGGSPAAGISYRADEELVAFFTRAQEAGLQVGVHAIGDAAIEQAISAWERVARHGGVERVRHSGHRIEHFECASDDHIRRARAVGLRASVQPAFDRLWGGPDGMYAQRIGAERAAEMNRFGTMLRAGLPLGAGSDSTVTPLDPFLQMAALRAHHVPTESLDPLDALRAHTVWAHGLAGRPERRGTLSRGQPADVAALDRDPLIVDEDDLLGTEVVGTWIAGVRTWPEAAAEAA